MLTVCSILIIWMISLYMRIWTVWSSSQDSLYGVKSWLVKSTKVIGGFLRLARTFFLYKETNLLNIFTQISLNSLEWHKRWSKTSKTWMWPGLCTGVTESNSAQAGVSWLMEEGGSFCVHLRGPSHAQGTGGRRQGASQHEQEEISGERVSRINLWQSHVNISN